MIVVNGPAAMNANSTHVEVLDRRGQVVAALSGSKRRVASELFQVIEDQLICH
jgi:hypothetical protein